MQFSRMQFPPTIFSRTTLLALAGIGALTALPASAQIAVTSASRSSTAYGQPPYDGGTIADSSTANGVFSATDTRYGTFNGTSAGLGSSTATQFSNISTVPTLLSVGGFGTSSLDSQYIYENGLLLAADSGVNVTFTLAQTTSFALFGSVSAASGSSAFFTLTDQTTNSTVLASTPNATFQASGSLLAGTYSLVADTNSSGPDHTSNGSFNFAFDAGPVTVAAVPEASTKVSFGLLLALGLGGVVIAAKKKKAAAAA